MQQGNLFIVSAPSGAGKTSLVQALVNSISGLKIAVSYTTRARRPGEVEGVHYHFVDGDRFEGMVRAGEFLEYAEVFDHRYGTSQPAVERDLAQGLDVILEIDWQGARHVRARMPGTVSIFVLPPSRQALETRLKERGQDDEAVIRRRMQGAVAEASHYDEYDYLVVNEDFEAALGEMRCIVQAQRLRKAQQSERQQALLRELLGP